MGEVWVAAAVTVVGGVVAGKAAEKKDEGDKAHQQAMSKEESERSAQRTAHQMALEDFYTQRDRVRKQRGLDQYRAFSTMSQISPGYDPNSEVRLADPTMPHYSDFDQTGPKANMNGAAGGGNAAPNNITPPVPGGQ